MKPHGSEGRLLALELGVIIPTLAGATFLVLTHLDQFRAHLIWWAIAVAVVELIPVPAWRGIHLSLAFPLLMALAILFPPAAFTYSSRTSTRLHFGSWFWRPWGLRLPTT
jgi:hypothetical protein